MEMIFNDLYIFSMREKRAKKISLSRGLNLITSSKADGTNRGKSVIMRSFYYCLGAETYFESEFNQREKIFVLDFSVDNKQYTILRSDNIYKIFQKQNKLMESISAKKLAQFMEKITNFAVQLLNRKGKLEITSPVYNYLPYYLDQDKHDGSSFNSFKNLHEYQNYKEEVLLYHFGVHNNDYYKLLNELYDLDQQLNEFKEKKKVNDAIILKVDRMLSSNDYSTQLDYLKSELDIEKEKYTSLLEALDKNKVDLIKNRNEIVELKNIERKLNRIQNHIEKNIEKLNQDKCPYCGNMVDNALILESMALNKEDDLIQLMKDVDSKLIYKQDIIEKLEYQYEDNLNQLEEMDKQIQLKNNEIHDILRYRGLCEIKDQVVSELGSLDISLEDLNKKIKSKKKDKNRYGRLKDKVEEEYYQMLVQEKVNFKLDEIDSKSFKKLTSSFMASGSDKDIVTIIWYFTIIQLRNKFNPQAIQFPIVLDSPCNTEMDDKKKAKLLKYLYDNMGLSPQFIMSGIGLENTVSDSISANIIKLVNDPFKLLNEDDYIQYKSLIEEYIRL